MRVECYAYEVDVSEIVQFVLYVFALQEAIIFTIVTSLVVQDLTEFLEKFLLESFKLWLDTNSDRLIEYHGKEASIGVFASGERVESSNSSSFPLPCLRDAPLKGRKQSLSKKMKGALLIDGPCEKTQVSPRNKDSSYVRRRRWVQHERSQGPCSLGTKSSFPWKRTHLAP